MLKSQLRLATIVASVAMGAAGFGQAARAQAAGAPSSLCPAGFGLLNGTCTNGNTGAFSGAALASQALSDLSESTTQQTNQASQDGVANRRDKERRRTVEPITPVRRPVPVVLPKPRRAPPAGKARKRPEPLPDLFMPAAPVYVEPAIIRVMAPRYGAWAQGFGDFEHRSAHGTSSINSSSFNLEDPAVFMGAGGPGGASNSLALTIDSRTVTAGFVGGFDVTIRSAVAPDDGLIVGVLGGFINNDITINSISTSPGFTVIPGDPNAVPNPIPASINGVGNGSGHLSANLSGASVGTYATYFDGGFSADATLKIDFLHLNENFVDNLAFTTSGNGVLGAGANAFNLISAGAGAASLVNTNLMGNLNYRFPVSPTLWIEPTAGVVYTITTAGGGAAQIGLADGSLFRVQAGARIGTDQVLFNRMLMTMSVTGAAFDDVRIQGGFVQGAGFANTNLLAQSDQGRIRGLGVFDVNLAFGDGFSTFAQANVRGGDNLIGVGGKGGVRYVW